MWIPGLRIDPLCLLARCYKRTKPGTSQHPWPHLITDDGLEWKRGPSWEPFRKNSALCSWQANQSWFRERRNSQAPNGSAFRKQKKHHITVRDLQRFLTSSWRFS